MVLVLKPVVIDHANEGSGTAGFIDRFSSTIVPCFPMLCIMRAFKEIGAAFKVNGDLKNALSSVRLRDSL